MGARQRNVAFHGLVMAALTVSVGGQPPSRPDPGDLSSLDRLLMGLDTGDDEVPEATGAATEVAAARAKSEPPPAKPDPGAATEESAPPGKRPKLHPRPPAMPPPTHLRVRGSVGTALGGEFCEPAAGPARAPETPPIANATPTLPAVDRVYTAEEVIAEWRQRFEEPSRAAASAALPAVASAASPGAAADAFVAPAHVAPPATEEGGGADEDVVAPAHVAPPATAEGGGSGACSSSPPGIGPTTVPYARPFFAPSSSSPVPVPLLSGAACAAMEREVEDLVDQTAVESFPEDELLEHMEKRRRLRQGKGQRAADRARAEQEATAFRLRLRS